MARAGPGRRGGPAEPILRLLPLLPLLLLPCLADGTLGGEVGDLTLGSGGGGQACSTVFVVALTGADHAQLRPFKAMAEAALASALHFHPSGCVAVLSNEAGVFESLRKATRGRLEECAYGEDVFAGPATFAYDRLHAYERFLAEEATARHSRHVVLMDADLLFVGSVEQTLERGPSFDVALTFRSTGFQPINTGLVLVRSGAAARGAALLREVVQVFDGLTWGRDPKRMLGDQEAVWRWMARGGDRWWDFQRMAPQRGTIGGYHVLLLPATEYNWTPHVGCAMSASARVLHFKGREKGRMLPAWAALRRAIKLGGGGAPLRHALHDVLPWIGVDEPMHAIHKARGTLIQSCPAT